MSTVKLIIRKNKINQEGKCLIYLQYCHNQNTKLISTQEKIEPENWDSENQRVKKSFRGHSLKNDLLKDSVQKIVREAKIQNIEPSLSLVKEEFEKETVWKQPKESEGHFFPMYREYIDSLDLRPNTIKQYNSSYNSLKDFYTGKTPQYCARLSET